MRSLAVICASPPRFNPGMHSVDVAFLRVLERHRIAEDVHFYCLPGIEPAVREEAALPIVYEDAYDNLPAIRDSDMVVYWGDFLHSEMYLARIRRRLRRARPDMTSEEVASVVRAVFFLEGARSRPRTVVAFGGNLSVLETDILADGEYLRNLRSLYENASLVLMRDPFSAIAVNHVMGDYLSNFCGVDCAFLLGDATSLSMYRSRSRALDRPPTVGVFTGRARSDNLYDRYLAFFRSVCEHLQTSGTWIPWFHDHRPLPLVEQYAQVFDATWPDTTFDGTLRRLDTCDVVLTDTYHLSINALARGIPTISIGLGANAMRRTTDDKKKELLYSMLGAGDLYVFAESLGRDELRSRSRKKAKMIDSVCTSLTKGTQMQGLFQRIDEARRSAETRLVEALR